MKTPHRMRWSVVEDYPDGSSIQIDYEDMPLPPNDPYVRRRERATGDVSRSEIVTEFAPAPSRPSTYPVDLPFLENRHVWTTESLDGSVSPGARWPCQDPDALIATVIGVSRADGWSVVPGLPASLTTPPSPDVPFVDVTTLVLGRLEKKRLLVRIEDDAVCVVQLLDLDGDWLEPPTERVGHSE